MPTNTKAHQTEKTSRVELHGEEAFDVLDELSAKLRQASAMAAVLNVATFAENVVLPSEDLQNFTTELAAQLNEVCGMVANLSLGAKQ